MCTRNFPPEISSCISLRTLAWKSTQKSKFWGQWPNFKSIGLLCKASDDKFWTSFNPSLAQVWPYIMDQFVGQRLYKTHQGKLSRRAQEVTGMPLINYNLQGHHVTKEPLKRTFSAFAGTTNNSGSFIYFFKETLFYISLSYFRTNQWHLLKLIVNLSNNGPKTTKWNDNWERFEIILIDRKLYVNIRLKTDFIYSYTV